jgi:hypothetical protein
MSDLDTLIRQGLGRLVDSTPIAPSFEQVTQSVPGPPLRSSTRRATHGRDPRLHILLAGAGMTVLVGAGVRYAVANSRNGDAPAHGGASVRLAGYTAHLPSGYLVSAAKIPDCRTFPVSAHPFPLESSSTYTIATPNATACIGSLLSATYGTGRSSHQTPDPLPPSGLTPIELGAYRAAIGRADEFAVICGSVDSGPACTFPVAGGTASTGNEVALWVQIPSTGGGYHDLVVGSWGLSEAELIALVQSALPKHAAAAEAGHPPWSVLPVCAPGQTPDADSPSGRACSDT